MIEVPSPCSSTSLSAGRTSSASAGSGKSESMVRPTSRAIRPTRFIAWIVVAMWCTNTMSMTTAAKVSTIVTMTEIRGRSSGLSLVRRSTSTA